MNRAVFDLTESPLGGVNLIEASAGTGKTYALAGLYLRLVTEARLAVDEILVVTFTVAATEELRGRIRARLAGALEAFTRGDAGGDPLLGRLLDRVPAERARADLQHALREFDQAAVFTIHGFCQRVLQEHAFESGASFDAELLPDPSDLLREAVRDFWRRHVAAAPAGVLAAAGAFSVADLLEVLSERLRHPLMEVRPRATAAELGRRAEACQEAFASLCGAWAAGRDEVLAVLSSDRFSRNRKGFRPGEPEALARALDRALADPDAPPPPGTLGLLIRLTRPALEGALRKGARVPDLAVVQAAEAFLDTVDAWQRAFVPAFLEWALDELGRRKGERGIWAFDDLLTGVYRALTGPGGGDLAASLRQRYRAALIDEFQDTDPLQYAIFRSVFSGGPLFLIGDPKQAIYGFRGADVFAYLEAAAESRRVYTLPENWRSDPVLVEGVARLFRGPRPFLLERIGLPPVRAAQGAKREPFVLDDEGPSLVVWFTEREDPSKPIPKYRAWKTIPRAVAAEVLRLLERGRIGSRPVEPGDIAVLIRKNRQAEPVQDALRRVGVPSVVHTTRSLFETDEAANMARLVAALASPGDERAVRAALAWDLFGLDGRALHAELGDEARWEAWLRRFREWHDTWEASGFLGAFRRILGETGGRAHLLRRPLGERRLTNTLHLAEVLHRAEIEGRLGMAGLLKWLSERIRSAGEAEDEYQLRLESDERAVQIVTVHRSKGLEYPIVFCPFVWEGFGLPKDEDLARKGLRYHPKPGRARYVLTFEPDEIVQALDRAVAEQMAEELRLFYVAVTRAKYRCYVVWGAYNGSGTSAPAYLLHADRRSPEPEDAWALAERLKNATDGELRNALEAVADGRRVVVARLPEPERLGRYLPPGREAFRPGRARFTGRVRTDWRVTSFTALAEASGPAGDEGEDLDLRSGPAPGETAPGAPGFLGFPAGARTGICIHEILEGLDFAAEEGQDVQEWVGGRLRAHGFDPVWTPAVVELVDRVRGLELVPGLRFGSLARKDRLHEVAFVYPVRPRGGVVTSRDLARALGDPDLERTLGADPALHLDRLEFAPVRGYLRGVIDLVFRHGGRYHLVDWKTNLLGTDPADYAPPALAAAVGRELYVFQYHLYALALHLHLRARLPGYDYHRHFGGVHYVFLRGIDPDKPGQGVFQDRPPLERLERLAACLGLDEGG